MPATKPDSGVKPKKSPKSYGGDGFVVVYDSSRCVHAAECVRCAPDVFDPAKRPWIQLDGVTGLRLSTIVDRCPSGALSIVGEDGRSLLPKPDVNSIDVAADGPLECRGVVRVQRMDGEEILSDTRLTLCRCGQSKNKPFCDNTHAEVGFQDSGRLGRTAGSDEPTDSQELEVSPATNGPLLVNGPCTIAGLDGSVPSTKVALCRCGASGNKPYCDGSHSTAGFRAE